MAARVTPDVVTAAALRQNDRQKTCKLTLGDCRLPFWDEMEGGMRYYGGVNWLNPAIIV
jgi:hypothetical protein